MAISLKPMLERILLSLLLGLSAVAVSAAQPLRLNEIQVLGSHNSYKLAMDPDRFAALSAENPALAESLEYWHLPLAQQLDMGIRKLELDVFYDPGGSLYGRRDQSASQFAVMHVQNLDDRSNCPTLIACLEVLRRWSERNPRHVPVFVSFNAKDTVIERPGFVAPRPFTESVWIALDAEIRAQLDGKLLTPEEVFRTGSLQWPLLDEVRGRFVLILDEGGEKRRTYASRWRQRAMFVNQPPGADGAAIMIINDPVRDFEKIQRLVGDGYIVRTRADADTREAREGDTRRRDRAIASGAQLISTDYYLPAAHFATDYVVRLAPGCNVVVTGRTCDISAAP